MRWGSPWERPARSAMLAVAAQSSVHGQLPPVTVYLAGLLAMLGCSAVYHVRRSCRWRDWLRRLDHAAIFVMIAGTYTPLVLRLPRSWAVGPHGRRVDGRSSPASPPSSSAAPHRGALSVALYLVLGWAERHRRRAAARPRSTMTTLILLLAGGVVYSAGVVFHLPPPIGATPARCGTARWCIAAAIHYAAIHDPVTGLRRRRTLYDGRDRPWLKLREACSEAVCLPSSA